MSKHVLVMYDVRGIQSYIFKTPKLKDAIGASAIVENIIDEALEYAVKGRTDISYDLVWTNESGAIEFTGFNKDVQVLYIGGGNAYVMYSSRELAVEINKVMSKYVLENTYSLQLAIAIIDANIEGDYNKDYEKLHSVMSNNKALMAETKPLGTLPFMEVELSTGLPIDKTDKDGKYSFETLLKLNAEKKIRSKIGAVNKKFDEFIECKNKDSTLAVVHIDGNNMGLRIKKKISNISKYVDAVNMMRKISFNINNGYKSTFEKMQQYFNLKDRYVLKVITAGDDITYVCTGKIAIASVDYFINEISNKYMIDGVENSEEYKFSVCAGIAYIRSHFPFSIGYEVAEACCDSAKDRAKKNIKNGFIGNFFDFQFCKSVQSTNLDMVREDEYKSVTGENLLARPYEIGGDENLFYAYNILKQYIDAFTQKDDKTIPRSFSKKIRNIYAMGENQINSFKAFLESRGWGINGKELDFYFEKDNEKYARYYDALELMDMYEDIDKIGEKGDKN